MKPSSLLILLLNCFCVFSQIPHEIVYVVGCWENSTTQVQYEFDGEELLYMAFVKDETVYSVPPNLMLNPSEIFAGRHVHRNALMAKRACGVAEDIFRTKGIHPPEEKDPPVSILYPADEVQLGVKNNLTCFVNHFYPPAIKVSWTKNGRLVSDRVWLSRYYPNEDQTFHMFSTLEFTPEEGDIYSCTVEHEALDWPQTRIWDVDVGHRSLGPDVFCGVGMTLGLLGIAGGTFYMVKGHDAHQ
ncbi:H-2 class II histocompatibility antigen, A-U alpha chain-like [Cheilinus undulatus]|uniref:H-2 class II histocompatibility antigen, A-U alpha chain-like n=1 Tax=Cheilinus undulatus TaxID=241271 RepID=UPI001BD3614D|nr:H-2 class II histocompatibility antigen, A-U alpha chain-like [Cheilinus undulatus]